MDSSVTQSTIYNFYNFFRHDWVESVNQLVELLGPVLLHAYEVNPREEVILPRGERGSSTPQIN